MELNATHLAEMLNDFLRSELKINIESFKVKKVKAFEIDGKSALSFIYSIFASHHYKVFTDFTPLIEIFFDEQKGFTATLVELVLLQKMGTYITLEFNIQLVCDELASKKSKKYRFIGER